MPRTKKTVEEIKQEIPVMIESPNLKLLKQELELEEKDLQYLKAENDLKEHLIKVKKEARAERIRQRNMRFPFNLFQ
jgi:hypothetical protein